MEKLKSFFNKWGHVAFLLTIVLLIVNIVLVCSLFKYVTVDHTYDGSRCGFSDQGGVFFYVCGITDSPGDYVRVYYKEYLGSYEYFVRDVEESQFLISQDGKAVSYDKLK